MVKYQSQEIPNLDECNREMQLWPHIVSVIRVAHLNRQA